MASGGLVLDQANAAGTNCCDSRGGRNCCHYQRYGYVDRHTDPQGLSLACAERPRCGRCRLFGHGSFVATGPYLAEPGRDRIASVNTERRSTNLRQHCRLRGQQQRRRPHELDRTPYYFYSSPKAVRCRLGWGYIVAR